MTIISNAYIPFGCRTQDTWKLILEGVEQYQSYSNPCGCTALALLNIIDYSKLSIFIF